ncbi:MFS transporter [Desulfobacula sp.]|uniref:MFS transporter n=1 Tax=Desulfobacula sp. TaxID=2593537 RepID=UPI0026339D92|nr:MFS transporter [Desulfobacula sp.]
MIFSFFILIAGFLWLQAADTLWKLYVFAFIYGFAHGGIFTIVSPIVAELFGIASHGSLFGMVVFFGTTGGAVGPIVTGYFFDISSSYNFPFGLFLFISILGLGLLLLLKPVKSTALTVSSNDNT